MHNPFRRPTYQHLNKILISQEAFADNYQALSQAHPEAQIAPVLKSNAYGHGLLPVARMADQLQPPFIMVDSLYEAYELYKDGIRTPILILGYTHPQNYQVKKLPFHFTVFDLETTQTLNQHQPGAQIHLFVDTGMSREGVSLKELPDFLKQLKQLTNLKLVGLASHFADADNPDSQDFSQRQLTSFRQALELVRQHSFDPQWRHISASGGAFKYHQSDINLIRAGIAFYGINPLDEKDAAHDQIELKPALRFQTTLAQVKSIPKGSKVSYNCTFTAPKEMEIGILPVGYYDGLDRRLSNKGVVTLNGRPCPIIGRVCMNITVVDLSGVDEARVGDPVVIYSDDPIAPNSFVNAAATAGTIPYELMVKLSESIRREVV